MNRDAILNQPPVSALSAIAHVALDMDGTIYNGSTLFPFTLPFLELLEELNVGYTFLTNNSSRSSEDYLAKLLPLGISISREQLYTSTQATLGFIQQSLPDAKRLFVLGTGSMCAEFTQAGFKLTEDSAKDIPDAVVVGFDTNLAYSRLCRAAYWISQGRPYIATHPDRVCPTDQPTVMVDCGAICAALKAATGRWPDTTLGKPDPCMIQGILRGNKLRAEQLAMVGDRVYTDIAMARRAGVLGVLVLTGETTAEQVPMFTPAPDLVVASLAEFGERLKQAKTATLLREPDQRRDLLGQ